MSSNPLGITQFGAFTLETAQLIASSGNNRLIETVRLQHTVTSGEVSAGVVTLAFSFGTAFADTNYTINATIYFVSAGGSGSSILAYEVYGFDTLTASGGNVSAFIDNSFAKAGDVIVFEIIAIHD
jgi:hypothetical protein